MRSPVLADAEDLMRWAASRRAEEDLPALVRRLVHATSSAVQYVGMPSGEGVRRPGYDGVIISGQANAYVPQGISVWEMGTDANVSSKAQTDYLKRTASQPVTDTGPVAPDEAVFVFVTPRRWNRKADWAAERRSEAAWRDVRVYDVDDLVSWLELAPAVHIWLSSRLGKRPPGIDFPISFWKDWSEATTPNLSAALMRAGRQECCDGIRAWLLGSEPGSIRGLVSDSPEESIALVGAIVETMEPDERESVEAKTVLVSDAESLEALIATESSLILVATFDAGGLAQRAARKGHQMLLILEPNSTQIGVFTVPRVSREEASHALEAMGLPRERARELGGLARRSMTALRRQLADNPAVRRPAWASPEIGPTLLPMLLLGTLKEASTGDGEELAALSGESRDAAIARLSRWTGQADPPIRRVADIWYVVSRADAWEALSRYLTLEVLERFVPIALRVLSSPDRAYDLPSEERWAAGVLLTEKPTYSPLLIKGIAESLALLGSRGEAVRIGYGVTAASFANRIVHNVLQDAQADWRRWASLAPALPLLAEAAPDVFLDAVQASLRSPEASVLGLFGHDTGSLGGSPHTHLLWALERLAWSPTHLGRVALVLAEVMRRDPGGRLANRPQATLRSIFLPWSPRTAASVERRLDVIDMLRKHEPDVAWKVMFDLLPRGHDVSFGTALPEWRHWVPESSPIITIGALETHANEIVSRMLRDAGEDAVRLCALVDALDDVPASSHDAIMKHLEGLDLTSLSPSVRAAVWGAARRMLNRHRSFSDADWALPAERVNAIDALYRKLEPVDAVDRLGWLFSHHPALPEGKEGNWDEHRSTVEQLRSSAARELYSTLAADEFLSFATSVEDTFSLGRSLCNCEQLSTRNSQGAFLRSYLSSPDVGVKNVGRGFLAALMEAEGESVLVELIALDTPAWIDRLRAEAFLVLPSKPTTWAAVDQLDDQAQRLYWQQVTTWGIADEHVAQAVEKYVEHGRPFAAMHLAAMHLAARSGHHDVKEGPILGITAESLMNTMMSAANAEKDPTGVTLSGYEVAEILDALEAEVEHGRADVGRVAQIELLYLRATPDRGIPRILERRLSEDPELLVEAVRLAYKPDPGSPSTDDEEEKTGADIAYSLLERWRGVPGLIGTVVDVTALSAWVESARQRLKDVNRLGSGDFLIGRALSASPPGSDGIWPTEAVRDVIERVVSDRLERGLYNGRFNARGVVTKHALAGGAAEHALADEYSEAADRLADRWPRTSALLRTLAETYRMDARREDDSAQLRHDLEL